MIGSDHQELTDGFAVDQRPQRSGGPFAMLAVLLLVWVTGRAFLWASPFSSDPALDHGAQLFAKTVESSEAIGSGDLVFSYEPNAELTRRGPNVRFQNVMDLADRGPGLSFEGTAAQLAAGHYSLWQAALTSDFRGTSWRARRMRYENVDERQAGVPVFPGIPAFIAGQEKHGVSGKPDRWSLGAWALVRDGLIGSRIAPGPAPVYGASQAGAILQYRVAPSRAADPRAYVRVTRSLTEQPESEVAAGVSARPIGPFPVRLAAEMRATDNAFAKDIRPATYAITEIPSVQLPFRVAAEVYAAAGYVGGDADTGFVDGQATLTRSLANFDLRSVDDVRVSVGAGAWGGAQRGVHRVDVGPTIRFDVSLGAVPARVSIDYRERVGGEASPASGVAATLSTQF